MREQWKDIAGHEGRYQVSNLGRVRSLMFGPRLLTPCPAPNGYLQVTLTGEGRWKTHKVHKLVAAAFLPPCKPGEIVRHWNGKQQDNRVSNLRHGTFQDNSDDAARHGTVRKGQGHPMAKLTDDDIRNIRACGGTNTAVAFAYGVSNQLVSRIRQGKIWKHI